MHNKIKNCKNCKQKFLVIHKKHLYCSPSCWSKYRYKYNINDLRTNKVQYDAYRNKLISERNKYLKNLSYEELMQEINESKQEEQK